MNPINAFRKMQLIMDGITNNDINEPQQSYTGGILLD